MAKFQLGEGEAEEALRRALELEPRHADAFHNLGNVLVELKLVGTGQSTLDVLDAGCGTGLCGTLLKAWARRLIGVDLSPKMIEKAQLRKVYDHLVLVVMATKTRTDGGGKEEEHGADINRQATNDSTSVGDSSLEQEQSPSGKVTAHRFFLRDYF